MLDAPAAGTAINPEWRIYARSASDDKAGVMAILTAFSALRAKGVALNANIKFFFEGEEEAGSPHLVEIIRRHKDLLAADAWIICDGPVHQSGRKQVVFGARGDTNVDVTVYAAKRPLHSGHYGNWSPNPAMMLARLLASMKDDAGRVMIDGWYSDVEPLGEAELRAIADAPKYDEELKKQLGLKRVEGGGKTLMELINVPSLNINGFGSGDVGALARNVIPTTATAVLDLRLVKGNDHHRQTQRLIDHIKKQGYHVIDRDPTDAERMQHPLIARVNVAARWLQCRTHAHGFADLCCCDRSGAVDNARQDRAATDVRWQSAAFNYYREPAHCDDLSSDRELRQQSTRGERKHSFAEPVGRH